MWVFLVVLCWLFFVDFATPKLIFQSSDVCHQNCLITKPQNVVYKVVYRKLRHVSGNFDELQKYV